MARIALDAMGGDLAPQAPVAGALLALAELPAQHRIQLVGRSAVVTAELDRLLGGEYAHLAAHRARIDIVEAPDVIEMTDKPTAAIRGKPKSSMTIGIKMHADGQTDAFVSAGNTGAQMAASVFLLKLHDGVTRPPIVTLLPDDEGPGRAPRLRRERRLLGGRARAVRAPRRRVRRRCPRPREPGDRTALDRRGAGEGERRREGGAPAAREGGPATSPATSRGATSSPAARRAGTVDVVVCDGFVGNVLLKFYESVPALIFGKLAASGVSKETLAGAFKGFDYSDYGGAPLLGVNGISIISHGRSSPRAIKNAIGVALRAIESQMDEHIGRRLAHVRTA